MRGIIFDEGMNQILKLDEAEDWDEAEQAHMDWMDVQIIDTMKGALRQVIDAAGMNAKAIMVSEEIKKEAVYGYQKLRKGGSV